MESDQGPLGCDWWKWIVEMGLQKQRQQERQQAETTLFMVTEYDGLIGVCGHWGGHEQVSLPAIEKERNYVQY